MKWLLLIFSVLWLMGCQPREHEPPPPLPEIPLRTDIARRVDNFTADWLLTPLHDVLSLEELTWLLRHRKQLSDAINTRITRGSTLAIQIAVFLRLETAIPVLREKLLTLRDAYGWEGPDYTTEAPWMSEDQYPYHCIYIWAIMGIAEAPLPAVIKLTPDERNALQQKASRAVPYPAHPDVGVDGGEVDGYAWCAKWLLTQLEPDSKGVE